MRADPANAVVNMDGMGLKMELLGSHQGTRVAGREARDGGEEEISVRVTFTGGSVKQSVDSESVSILRGVAVVKRITAFFICHNYLSSSPVSPRGAWFQRVASSEYFFCKTKMEYILPWWTRVSRTCPQKCMTRN